MICSEGYKAFRGTMRIVPKNPNMKPYELTTDWLYKPEYQCWYGRGSSFPEEICEVLVDLTETPSNEPLTIDQLREMDGEPVWVERPGYGARWALVEVWAKSTNIIYLIQNNGSVLQPQVELDCGGKIYRYKPEDGAV